MVTGEITKPAEGAPEKPLSQAETESTSKYTQADLDKKVSDALAEQGRKHKAVLSAAEKKALEAVKNATAQLEAERADLQSKIEELAKDDDDRTRLVKMLKEVKEKQKTLDAKEAEWGPRIAKAQEAELKGLCSRIAKEFEGADPEKLARRAFKMKFDDDESREDEIRELASDLWPKAKVEEKPRTVDSNVTTGQVGGRRPTLEELKAASPEDVVKKFASGEWIR